jgi:signal recognition particle receptor subunit beta
MALVNHAKKEINVKLVFFGPRGSGKSTTLQYIYKKLKPDCRGQLKTLQTQGGRMLFFDFMPADLPSIEGYRARFHLYTLTDEPIDSPTWKMVLKGVDGVIFVADSTSDGMEGNLAGIAQVRSFLADNGKDLSGTSFVLQCNKQDLPEGSPASDIASALGLEGEPAVATRAVNGGGVLQTLSSLVKIVMKELREKGPGTPPEEPEESAAEAAIPPEPASEADETMVDYAGQVCEPPVDESEDFDDKTPAGCGMSVRIAGSIVTMANVVKIPLVVRNVDREQLVTVSLAITVET